MRFMTAFLSITLLSSFGFADDVITKVHNMDEVDVKVDVRSEDIATALQKLKLKDGDAEKLSLYFLDTPDLLLFSHHLSVRARQGAKSDLQVKIRPAQPDQIDPSLFHIKGFKCKYDQTKSDMVPDCAMKADVDAADIAAVAKGKTSPQNLLNSAQIDYAETYGVSSIPWDQVKALGPVQASDWQVTLDNGNAVDVELWTLPGYQFLEFSEKAPTGQEDDTRQEILNLLSRNQLQESAVGQNKTEFVMKIFAGQH